MKNPLYNKTYDSYAIWNGNAWEDKNITGAYFYGVEKANNNGYYEVSDHLDYYKKNAESLYMTTPIGVLRYITQLEERLKDFESLEK